MANNDYNSSKAKTIECKDCGREFVVTEQEQKWYQDKGFDLPKRCPTCRKAKRSTRKQ